MFKKIIFFLTATIIFIVGIFSLKGIDTEITRAFLDNNSNLIKLAQLSSKNLNIIFESDSPQRVEELKNEYRQYNPIFSNVIKIYGSYPENFLSEDIKSQLEKKDYKTIENDALIRLYNPFGIFLADPSNDPYMLSGDFLNSLSKKYETETKEYQGKFYSSAQIEIKNNKELENILNKQKQLDDGKIYLTGTPIHSYLASKNSSLEINIICIISTLALILLCKFYFKSYKIIFPILASIIFGFLMGFSVPSIIFHKIHILTFVFSTSLIGISLDYSLHYYLNDNNKLFIKSLTNSMLTTVFAFLILNFSGIELLKQIGMFTASGLLGVYLFVVFILSKNNNYKINNLSKFDLTKIKPLILSVILGIIVLGFFNLKFNDNLKNLYTPPKELIKSETLNQELFGQKNIKYILINGKNTNEILEKEEKLNIKNSISLSDFIFSTDKQKENFLLVKELYKNNLKSYGKFLSQAQIKALENKNFAHYDVENFPLKQKFMLDNNTSFIITSENADNAIDPALEISKELKKIRIQCLKLFPIVFVILYLFLSFNYGLKQAFRIIISPLLGILFSISIISLFNIPINLFNILALFLILGFSLDYSIFRTQNCEKSKDAVFISFLSTAFSFLMLSFVRFKLISSLGITLFIGITISYLLSLFMIKSGNE